MPARRSQRPNDGPERLRAHLAGLGLAAGDRLPTEHALARALRLSQPTVHRALASLAADGVIAGAGRRRALAVAPDEDLQPGALLVGPPLSRFVREDPTLHAGRQDAIGWSLLQHLNASGRMLTVVPPAHAVAALVRLAPPPGAVLVVQAEDLPPAQVADLLAWADRHGRRCVLYADPAQHPGRACVTSDQAGGCAGLVRHLAARGRRRILPLWFGDVAGRVVGPWFARRQRGYRRACRELGLEALPAAVLPDAGLNLPPTDALAVAVRQCTAVLAPLLARGLRCDAILAPTDGVLPALAEALRGLGVDPDRAVLLAGFDNYFAGGLPERRLAPCRPVATVDKDHPAIGRALAELVLEPAPGRNRLIPAHVAALDGRNEE